MALFNKLGNYRNFGLLIIRIGLGLMFILHGYPKLLGGVKEWKEIGQAMGVLGIHFLPVMWGLLSALTEAVGGLLLLLGIQFRLVCLLMLINMIVAALFHLHQHSGMAGLMDAAHPIEDGVVFLGLLFVGPGKYSVDKK